MPRFNTKGLCSVCGSHSCSRRMGILRTKENHFFLFFVRPHLHESGKWYFSYGANTSALPTVVCPPILNRLKRYLRLSSSCWISTFSAVAFAKWWESDGKMQKKKTNIYCAHVECYRYFIHKFSLSVSVCKCMWHEGASLALSFAFTSLFMLFMKLKYKSTVKYMFFFEAAVGFASDEFIDFLQKYHRKKCTHIGIFLNAVTQLDNYIMSVIQWYVMGERNALNYEIWNDFHTRIHPATSGYRPLCKRKISQSKRILCVQFSWLQFYE